MPILEAVDQQKMNLDQTTTDTMLLVDSTDLVEMSNAYKVYDYQVTLNCLQNLRQQRFMGLKATGKTLWR